MNSVHKNEMVDGLNIAIRDTRLAKLFTGIGH